MQEQRTRPWELPPRAEGPVDLAALLAQIQQGGRKRPPPKDSENGSSPPGKSPPSRAQTEMCAMCSGNQLVLDTAGQVIPCPRCGAHLWAAQCGLSDEELQITAAQIGAIGGHADRETQALLRWLVEQVIDHPVGWVTLWGSYGTAKTMAVQAMVAGLVHSGVQALFYHARRLEQGWFDDMRGDTSNAQLYRRARVLAIDEADKINLKSDWTRTAWQELMDDRYRSGLAGRTCTLLVCQHDPAECMPGDVASRMADGRFYRPWSGGKNRQVVTKPEWGPGLWLPGIVRVQGQDMRPHLPPKTHMRQGATKGEVATC